MAVPGQLWVPTSDFRPPSFFSMNPQFLKKSKLSLLRLFEPKSSKIDILALLVTSVNLPWLREAKVDLPCQKVSKLPKMTYFSTFSLFREVIPTPGQGNLTQMSTLSTPLRSHPTLILIDDPDPRLSKIGHFPTFRLKIHDKRLLKSPKHPK